MGTKFLCSKRANSGRCVKKLSKLTKTTASQHRNIVHRENTAISRSIAMRKRIPSIKLFRITNQYDVTANQVCHYVQALHRHIRKQNARIQRLKKKVKSLRLQRIKTCERNGAEKEQASDQIPEEASAVEPLDIKAFVDDIKKTAQDVDIQNRYIYEPTSGLYYDPETGYYYNSIYGLHYDGHRGCYLKYNEDTKEYDFYSQVVPETMLETEPKAKQKKKKRVEPKESVKKSADSDDSAHDVRRHHKRKHRHKKRHRKGRRRRSRSRSRSSSDSESSSSSARRSRKRRKSKRRHRKSSSDDVKEEGELESSDGSHSRSGSVVMVNSSDGESEDSAEQFNTNYKDVAKRYPPSLRIIVKETNVKDLKVGSLFIVTCKGGSLGREGNHDVIIPDINVSKRHLQFTYNAKKGSYQFVDLASRNGTLYNGVRVPIEEKQTQSEPQTLLHGSVLQLNQTKLLCHVHEGNATCGKCEPGLLVSAEPTAPIEIVSKITKPVSHKEGLKLIQKRFGLENEKYVPSGEAGSNNAPDYQDRAAVRRKVKGSSNEHEKTQVASLDQSIGSNNKGFQMLSKLGWNEGKPLGKNDDGLTEPIPLKSNVGTSGLGSLHQTVIGPASGKPVDPRRHTIWRKTQERFERSMVFTAASSEESE